MSPTPNQELGWRVWTAVAEADTETLREIWSEKIIWHSTGRNPRAGTYEGPDAILDYLAEVGESVDVLDASLDDVLSSENRIGLVFHLHSELGGRTLDVGISLLARVEDGKIAEVWMAPLDPLALERFWQDE